MDRHPQAKDITKDITSSWLPQWHASLKKKESTLETDIYMQVKEVIVAQKMHELIREKCLGAKVCDSMQDVVKTAPKNALELYSRAMDKLKQLRTELECVQSSLAECNLHKHELEQDQAANTAADGAPDRKKSK